MEYNFIAIEQKWRKFWADHKTFKAVEDPSKEKFYVLDMFPYPSGAGLHVGHPLGYIASDIYARYKRLKGYNVLHPMGYDSFGLPAEQYAIQTGQHPEKTTAENIARYREQLDKIGFSYDWEREVRTSSPEYYKWTQWIFKQFFNSWYNKDTDRAEDIETLIERFATTGNAGVNAASEYDVIFDAATWNAFGEQEKEAVLQEYRLAYLADSWVNWCPALGTVLANDEVVNGVSERGGHPVEQKRMRQWSMRISAYAERLIQGLDKVDWTESIKDQQRNWIGKSKGASVRFAVEGSDKQIEVFTTRPDTIFGVSFMVLAPEHPYVEELTTTAYKEAVEAYQKQASLKSERDRQSDVKNISGQFIGAHARHPFTGEKVQIWIGDYVLATYGTGAVMAVPCGDQRDYDFATHFQLEIKNIFQDVDISEAAYTEKDAVIANSDFLNGLDAKVAIEAAIKAIEEKGIGKGKTQYRLRDAIFSRQRYWGEPFPVYYENEVPKLVDDAHLPIVLPEVDKYLPTEDGEPPLARAEKWEFSMGDRMEYNTMPGWAGSSWYFLRYMDPTNENEFVSKEKVDYWKNVDLYIGGSEHATGHLLYARFWTKFLFDKGYIPFDEPFQKMINQGMILGRSSFVCELHSPFQLNPRKYDVSEGKNLLEHVAVLLEKRAQYPDVDKYSVLISIDIVNDFVEGRLSNSAKDRIRQIEEEIKLGCGLLDDNDVIIKFDLTQFNLKRVDIAFVDGDVLDIDAASKHPLFRYLSEAILIKNDQGKFICGHEVEKMSKSKYNVQTPDELVDKFGADTLRMYEMFLGPLEQAKPWDTKGINGVHNFLRKLWRLFNIDEQGTAQVSSDEPTKENLKTLHKTIKKVTDDLERYSFNTGVSNFMICVNELTDQKCNNKAILKELVVLLSPYAPHIAEELWAAIGEQPGTVSQAAFPTYNEAHMVEANYAYPVSFNGKMRFKAELALTLTPKEVETEVLAMEEAQKWLEGKAPKKVIVVPGKIVNVVY